MSSGVKFTPHSKQLVEKAFRAGLKFAAEEQILTDCNYYCKEQSGDLKDSSQHNVKELTLKLSWGGTKVPYAKRQWYTGTPSKTKNPNASLKWGEVAQKEHNKDWIRQIEKGMKENL